MTTTSSAQQRTQQTAGTTADESKHVAGVAKDEAAGVASEAAAHARDIVGDAVRNAGDQAAEQTRTQRDRLTGTLRTLGDDLDSMAAQSDSGLAGDLAREAAQRAHAISHHLDGREPGELLDDVRRFARQRPGTFLLGALGAGVVAGRLLRGTKDGVEGAAAQSRGRSVGSASPSGLGTPGAQGTQGTQGTAGISAQRTAPTDRPAQDQGAVVPGERDVATEAATRAGVVGYDSGTTLEDDLLGGGGTTR